MVNPVLFDQHFPVRPGRVAGAFYAGAVEMSVAHLYSKVRWPAADGLKQVQDDPVAVRVDQVVQVQALEGAVQTHLVGGQSGCFAEAQAHLAVLVQLLEFAGRCVAEDAVDGVVG